MATTTKASQRSQATAGNSSGQSNAEILLRVSNALAEAADLDEQLRILVAMMTDAVGADRSTLFLHDDQTSELYSRVMQGDQVREIRLMDDVGIAGHVYQSAESLLIPNAYDDERFDPSVDERTGYKTKTILCAPIRTVRGEILGVAQALNKRRGRFSKADVALMEAITVQASIVLEGSLSLLKMRENQEKEAAFLDIVVEISSEIQLGRLLQLIISMVTKMLSAERSTLFLNDEKTNELYTEIGEGLGATKIRFPNNVGIAGTVFQSAKTINLPYAYADLRFNPAFDKQTGFFTRSLLCVPVTNKDGKVIGVTQVLNKIGGTFTDDDETRLKAFTAQISIALENAKLFNDIQSIKNYNESVLESMSNGVVTFDAEQKIVTCNQAGLKILESTSDAIVGKTAEEFFGGTNDWVLENLSRVGDENDPAIAMDAALQVNDETKSVNLTALPLLGKDEDLGSMVLIEDISSEKRMKSTMSRYMDAGVVDKLLGQGEDILGGQTSEATVLFSDIRSFTTITEQLGAQGTVGLLNDYFTLMVECIEQEGGMLDKFIGDAIMAIFGTPIAHEDDPDRGVRTAIDMMQELARFNQDREAHGLQSIDIGIGLNTDQVVSGNIGSPKRMDYTVIGDGVNLAARLESACKQYGAHILISEFTHKQLRSTYRTRDIDSVIVKGKTEPVRVFEVLDYHTDQTFPAMTDVLGHFRDGLTEYRTGNWDKAIATFEQALALHANDKASQLYIGRCQHLKENPPEDEWEGVWVMDSK